MADQKIDSVDQTTEATEPSEGKGKKGLPVASKPFEKLEEAPQFKPESPRALLFQVTRPDGSQVFLWAGDNRHAAYLIARSDGYAIAEQGKAPSKAKVASML